MITITSHGFKYGRPDANIYFDVSYFINPWRDLKIRKEQDPEKRYKMILEHMLNQENVENMVRYYSYLLSGYEDSFPGENIRVAFCCSAGEYRSPAIAHLVYNKLKKKYKADVELEEGEFSKMRKLPSVKSK